MSRRKQREHNEWVQTSSCLSKCPSCKSSKLARSKSFDPNLTDIMIWGEYQNAKWHTVKFFCNLCAEREFIQPLMQHAKPCGCIINLVPRHGYWIPNWLQDIWNQHFGQYDLFAKAS